MLYLDNLPTLRAGTSGLNHFPGGLAVFGQLEHENINHEHENISET